MESQEEVVKIKKSLEKMMANQTTDTANAVDLLKQLKAVQMSLEVLQKTRIGITVNNFRKSTTNDEVNSLAKGLIKSWKKFLHDNGTADSRTARISRSSSSTSSRRDSIGSTTSSNDCDDSMNEDKNVASGGGGDASTTADTATAQSTTTLGSTGDMELSCYDIGPVVIPKASVVKDSVRIKCRELLAQALRTPPIVDGTADIDDVAAAIEDAIFSEFKNTEMKYKNRVRSRIANLKDTKNPRLRENVLLCHVSPARLAVMTPEEMASDEMKKIRERLSREAFNDHQMSVNSGTMSDLFQCSRCKKRNTTYNQLQTRSSDEPMTTFVLCNECGNRWKFC